MRRGTLIKLFYFVLFIALLLLGIFIYANFSFFSEESVSGESVSEESAPFFTEAVIQKQQVAETAYWYILLDYAPITPGHLLAVAKSDKTKYHTIDELPQEAFTDLALVTQKIKQVFTKHLDTEDYILLQKNGTYAGQMMQDVYMHYIPIESTKWRMFGQLKVFVKILFGSSPDGSLEENVKNFRGYFIEADG